MLAAPGAKPQVRRTFGIAFDPQARPAPVCQPFAGQHLFLGQGQSLAGEQLVQRTALVLALRLEIEMLQVAAAAAPVIRTGRRRPLGGRRQALDDVRLVEALALTMHGDPYPFAGQGLVHEDRLAVRVARGWPTSCPGTTGVHAAVSGGILSVPGECA